MARVRLQVVYDNDGEIVTSLPMQTIFRLDIVDKEALAIIRGNSLSER